MKDLNLNTINKIAKEIIDSKIIDKSKIEILNLELDKISQNINDKKKYFKRLEK